MSHSLHFQQRAMATLFEGWLVGADLNQLRAISHSLKEELLRLELLMSCHDPLAEVSRLNREAFQQAVKVEPELVHILRQAIRGYQDTEGYFDISYRSPNPAGRRFPERIRLDLSQYRVQYLDSDLTLDLGGFGKGYALDVLGQMCLDFGVRNFLLNGGGSSMIASGVPTEGKVWQIQLAPDAEEVVMLNNEGFAYSATFHQGEEVSDLVDPHTAQPVQEVLACAVWAPLAARAEIYSTALLAMGKDAAERFITFLPTGIRVQLLQPIST